MAYGIVSLWRLEWVFSKQEFPNLAAHEILWDLNILESQMPLWVLIQLVGGATGASVS